MRVQFRKNSDLQQSLGITNANIAVTNETKTYTIDFKASGFRGTTTDSRLTFNFKLSPDATYTIDNVSLVEID